MRAPGENPPTFEESIELNKSMTPQEATKKLATFHGTSPKNVLAAFMNLRNAAPNHTVEFIKSINSGYPCIAMEGKTPDGNFAWDHLIDKYTGQPQMRCG
ncbi:MAG: hypothetical protein AAB739_04585 [Patescibacteria group bacterium]